MVTFLPVFKAQRYRQLRLQGYRTWTATPLLRLEQLPLPHLLAFGGFGGAWVTLYEDLAAFQLLDFQEELLAELENALPVNVQPHPAVAI